MPWYGIEEESTFFRVVPLFKWTYYIRPGGLGTTERLIGDWAMVDGKRYCYETGFPISTHTTEVHTSESR